MSEKKEFRVPAEVDAASEIDLSGPRTAEFDTLSRDRVPVRSLAPGDLEALARIDRKITGQDRSDYLGRKLDEALLDSGVRVSLLAELDGAAAGFVMAKMDFGEFGRTEPVAVIDTIGVDPGFAGRGVGKALLSQLLINLAALGVERLETTVALADFELLGFLYHCGFEPSERLAFVKKVGVKS